MSGIAPGKLDTSRPLTALDLAMARQAKLALPEQVAAPTLPPGLLRALALSPSAGVDTRLAAAERAEMLGAFDIDSLRQLFLGVPFTPQELGRPLAEVANDKSPRGHALLYRQTELRPLPGLKAEAIAKALAQAADPAAFAAAARLYAGQIAQLPPGPELAEIAPLAVRALLAAGQPVAAKGWYEFLRIQGQSDEKAAAAAAAVWPLARLAGIDGGIPASGAFAAWRKTRAELASEPGQRKGVVLLALLNALGDAPPGEDWLAVYDGQPLLSQTVLRPALRVGLESAAADHRLGGVLLFGLAGLGDPAQLDPAQLGRILGHVNRQGLTAEAHAMAVDIALANGL